MLSIKTRAIATYMKIDFYKYQGTGNDFIMIDVRDLKVNLSIEIIQKLCDRRFGIGADGLIVVQPHAKYDFEMVYYNADGSQSFCGNGSRCAQAFAKKIGLIEDNSHFLAIDGVHYGELRGELFATKMSAVSKVEKKGEDYLINTGSPHYIRYESNVDNVDVFKEGRSIRNSDEFIKEGVNVNFVSEIGGKLKVRTYERGVEAETFSCGTGVTAAAISYVEKSGSTSNSIDIITKGGNLAIELSPKTAGSYQDIWLVGPAVMVFKGEVLL